MEEKTLSEKIIELIEKLEDAEYNNTEDRCLNAIKRLKLGLLERTKEIKLWEADALMEIYSEEIDKILGEFK